MAIQSEYQLNSNSLSIKSVISFINDLHIGRHFIFCFPFSHSLTHMDGSKLPCKVLALPSGAIWHSVSQGHFDTNNDWTTYSYITDP